LAPPKETQTKIDIETMLEAVVDEQTFLRFLEALAVDWEDGHQNPASSYGRDANGWENGTIGAYLDASASWGQASINGLPQKAAYEKPSNSWRRAAQILYMGKIYE
jgi:hypothetical protein